MVWQSFLPLSVAGVMNIDLKQLETFVRVAELQSFIKAAEKLNTTQPNVSGRIAKLEANLDCTLFERRSGTVELTVKGQELLVHATAVLQASEDFLMAANRPALFDGILRLGATELVAYTWLRTFLREMKSRFPSIRVELTIDLSTVIDRELIARNLDLGLHNRPFDSALSGELSLGSHPFVWVAAPTLYPDGFPSSGSSGNHSHVNTARDTGAQSNSAHANTTQSNTTQSNTAKAVSPTILTPARDTVVYEQIKRYTVLHLPAARIVTTNNLSASLYMAIDGIGVAALPESMVKGHIERGELAPIDLGWVPDGLAFFARFDAALAPIVVREAAQLAADIASQGDAFHTATPT